MPAAAVIPAPIAYIKVVAVKKLVVGFWAWTRWSASSVCTAAVGSFLLESCVCSSLSACGIQDFYFEKIRVFKAGLSLEYISME